MSEFYQDGPTLKNQFTSDLILQNYLRHNFPPDLVESIISDLKQFGERVVQDVYQMSLQAESQLPRLVAFDPWGRAINHIEVSPAWQQLDQVAAEEGLIAIGYERKFAEFSRLYQYLKLFLFHPSSAYYSCPLAMTDGAAKLLEVHGDHILKDHALRHLTSRDPKQFWTSGQWMTERTGGSDVSGTETTAEPLDSKAQEFGLYGTKWFTSATTSQMAMTLAREKDQKGLTLFYLELRDKNKNLNQIEVLRLKDKLGTKALPTAELRLSGTRAKKIGQSGDGVKNIATLFNVTRIHNAIAATSSARRVLALLIDYSTKRVAFKNRIIEKPLHQQLLGQLIAEYTGCFLLTMHTAKLLGSEEVAKNATSGKLLRILTPLTKLFTAKMNMNITSECVEGFGGAGYIEDVGIAKFLRDSQTLTIWEGTTNVLSLDVLRAIHKEEALPYFFADVEARLSQIKATALTNKKDEIRQECTRLKDEAKLYIQLDLAQQEHRARQWAMNLAKLYIKALILEFADQTKSPEYVETLNHWLKFQRPVVMESLSLAESQLLLKSF